MSIVMMSLQGQRYARVQKKRKGDYARKINIGYSITKEPVLFMGATDLVFHEGWLEAGLATLGDGIHVSMYIGHGKMIHASNPGRDIVIDNVYWSGFAGARRYIK